MKPLVGDTKYLHDIRRTRRGGRWAIPVVLRRDPPPHLAQPSSRRPRPGDEWLDEVAVERAVRGREPVGRPLTRSERIAVVQRLTAAGSSDNDIARRLHVSKAELRRLRESIRQEAL
ncbi:MULTISPECIES: hypothetical protein [unclassified Saccharopolyspora]|uniref:hypothetical protein n=1 Tax=unclassified Saccharopolyspora TaxID=2646250 RepID=UPI001CD495C5|nr:MULTISPECIES: hypothetical protein [unclassified Saccharopolyspora]MCA1185789.1 hypothetical protein [Saccharopolyspora sp. 6T]MCA1191701.1 hypothetical protein [Saccharopolyspora sp. 6V]